MTVTQLVQALLLLPQELEVEVVTQNESGEPTEVHVTEPYHYEIAGVVTHVPARVVIR